MMKTWRQWMELGRQHARAGTPAAYPSQRDYMAGFNAAKRPQEKEG